MGLQVSWVIFLHVACLLVTWGNVAQILFILEPSVKGQELPGGTLRDGSSSTGQSPLSKHISNPEFYHVY